MINKEDCAQQIDKFSIEMPDNLMMNYYLERANAYDFSVYSEAKAKALRVLIVCYMALSAGVREVSSRSAKAGSQSFKQKDSLKALASLINQMDDQALADDVTENSSNFVMLAVGGY